MYSGKTIFELMRKIVLCVCFVLVACSNSEIPQPIIVTGPTMGTTYTVKYFVDSGNAVDHEFVENEVSRKLARVNELMSTYIDDSELNRLNAAPIGEPFQLSPETFEVIFLAWQTSDATKGAFDATVSPLVDVWGFGSTGRSDQVPDEAVIRELMNKVGYRKLDLNPASTKVSKNENIRIDLSAIAKGFAVDYLAEFLRQQSIKDFMIEVGGEIYASGNKPQGKPWRIAIESPLAGTRKIQRILDLKDVAVATSGDYRNYFERDGKRYSHTIDPRTGYPIDHRLASVTVLHEHTAAADALATAFMVMGPDDALQHANFHKIAALFIIKGEEGFIEQSSDSFPH